MKFDVRVRMDPGAVLGRMGLRDGSAQRYLTRRVLERSDRYVPLDTGYLKNSAYAADRAVVYPASYAAKQFYVNYRHRDPARGDHWHSRMLRSEGPALVRDLTAYMKGGTP